MNRYIVLCLVGMFVVSCGPRKGVVTKKKNSKTERVVTTKTPEQPIPSTPTTPDVTTEKTKPINSTAAYIDAFSGIAMLEMQRYKIPASITLAQGILESGAGRGRLAVEANNHFGIKCHGWTGEKIYHDDDAAQECFRKYDRALSSFEDHSLFLTGRSRYADLFKLKPDDYKGWAKGLRKAGYATDRQYPEKLISLIERYQLYQYDNLVLNKPKDQPPTPEVLSTNERVHVVKPGDTLYSLSKLYQTTVENLQKLNKLSNTNLSVGQELIIK